MLRSCWGSCKLVSGNGIGERWGDEMEGEWLSQSAVDFIFNFLIYSFVCPFVVLIWVVSVGLCGDEVSVMMVVLVAMFVLLALVTGYCVWFYWLFNLLLSGGPRSSVFSCIHSLYWGRGGMGWEIVEWLGRLPTDSVVKGMYVSISMQIIAEPVCKHDMGHENGDWGGHCFYEMPCWENFK